MAILLCGVHQHQYNKDVAVRKNKSKTNQTGNDVLHVGIRSATALAAEIVEPRDPVHEEVDDSNNNSDSN